MNETVTAKAKVASYLDRYGWAYERTGEDVWISGWRDEKRSYPLVLTYNDTLLSFTVAPLAKMGAGWHQWPELMRFLLELNHDCRLVKISIDNFGDVCLSLQLFNERLNYDDFCDALGVLGHYAGTLFEEISLYANRLGLEIQVSGEYLI